MRKGCPCLGEEGRFPRDSLDSNIASKLKRKERGQVRWSLMVFAKNRTIAVRAEGWLSWSVAPRERATELEDSEPTVRAEA